MDCADLVRLLADGSRVSDEAREHLSACRSCRELACALDAAAQPDPVSAELVRGVKQALSRDLRPVSPLKPLRLVAAFLAIFLLIAAIGVFGLGAYGIGKMTPRQSWVMLATIAAVVAVLTTSVVGQMLPGSRFRIRPAILPFAIVALIGIVMTGVFQFEAEADFWKQGARCLVVGLSLALLATVPFWAILRKGAILSPALTGASAGLLAGLVGVTVLELHCPDLHAQHVLTWHAGVAAVASLAGLILGEVTERAEA